MFDRHGNTIFFRIKRIRGGLRAHLPRQHVWIRTQAVCFKKEKYTHTCILRTYIYVLIRMFCRGSGKTFVKNCSEIDGRAYDRQCCDAVVRRETYDHVLASESFDLISEVSVLGRVFRTRRRRFTTIETAKHRVMRFVILDGNQKCTTK